MIDLVFQGTGCAFLSSKEKVQPLSQGSGVLPLAQTVQSSGHLDVLTRRPRYDHHKCQSPFPPNQGPDLGIGDLLGLRI